MTRRDWWFFFGLQLLVHILLDAFNAYGTGWFEPFDHYRVSFHTLFVVDPFYSVWLGIGFIALLLIRGHHPARRGWAWFGLIASTAYLGYCTFNKVRIDAHARAELQRQQLTFRRFISTPTPLNGLLWFVVAEDSGGFYTGYRSVFDHGPMHFRFQSRNAGLLEPWRKDEDLHCLVRFSQGFYTVEKWGDTLVFNDLRFGEMRGWEDPKARFVFHYFIQYPERNRLVVQRGRFEGWNGHTVRAMIRRIRGG